MSVTLILCQQLSETSEALILENWLPPNLGRRSRPRMDNCNHLPLGRLVISNCEILDLKVVLRIVEQLFDLFVRNFIIAELFLIELDL